MQFEMLIDKADEAWCPSHQLLARIQRVLGVAATAS